MTTFPTDASPVLPARRPLITRRFKVVMAIFAALGLLVLGGVVLKTHIYHTGFHQYGEDQVFVIEKALAKNQDLQSAAASVSFTTVGGSDGTSYNTKATVLPHKNFTYRLTVNDGYVYSYDSRTGFFSGTCTNLGCWIGLRTSA